ncbi:CDP-alcohol phosphatidyltransferase family protein [Bradyrhizobium betae]
MNAISLSRIPLSVCFVFFFQPTRGSFAIAVACCFLAFASDVLDGYLARRLHVATVAARHWDSLGDKAFYVSIVVAFLSNGILSPILSWGLLFREIALYITRIIYIQNIENVERIRPYTNWHGYLMYVMIVLGILEMYGRVSGVTYGVGPLIAMAACMALGFGVVSIFAFMRLEQNERP